MQTTSLCFSLETLFRSTIRCSTLYVGSSVKFRKTKNMVGLFFLASRSGFRESFEI